MRSYVHMFFLFLLVTLVGSCSKEKNDCMKSTGEIVFEDRGVHSFLQIEVYNNVNVILTQDTFSSVTVEAGKNLIGKVTTVVVGDSLIIRNDNKCNWIRSYKYDITVHVTVKNLTRITHRGYGKISGTNTIQSQGMVISILGNGDVELNIDMNYCYSDMHKSGDLILSGSVGTNGLWASGNGWIHCENLVTDTTFVESRTTGDCFVNASVRFQALVGGVGNIYYSGNPPDVDTKIIGEGEIFKN